MESSDLVSTEDSYETIYLSESLVPSQVHKQATTTSTTFDGLLDPPLLLKEDLKEGCGGQLWPAGMVLAKYMLRKHHADLKQKTMFACSYLSLRSIATWMTLIWGRLELGAGGGLVGLAVAKGCATDGPLFVTDQVPMLSLMRQNIELNGLSSQVEAMVLDWGEPIPAETPQPVQILLAADCVYFEPAFPLLLSTLQALIGPETVCYFSFKKRRRADMRFMKQARKFFDVREVDNDRDREVYSKEQIFLYILRRKTK
jgi:protein N-lysine methyltransferase METTL21A